MLPFDENAYGESQKPLRPNFDIVMSVQNVSVKKQVKLNVDCGATFINVVSFSPRLPSYLISRMPEPEGATGIPNFLADKLTLFQPSSQVKRTHRGQGWSQFFNLDKIHHILVK